MNKQCLLMVLAASCHGTGHAATLPVEAGEAPEQSEVQRQRDPTVGKVPAPATPGMPAQPGAVDPATGQYYAPAGNSDVINPATGERYIGTPGGYINPNNGQFMPKIP